MFSLGRDDDTVCAIATAPGNGGIAVLRLSGLKAISIARKLCGFLPEQPESHRVYYGFLKRLDDGTSPGEKLDEVLVTYFAAGRSFTGEETIEISCHGGRFLSSLILQELVSAGARLAQPGEFTYRAFMNQRIDLVQAEAVLELVHSENSSSAKLALRQLEGGYSSELKEIKEELTLGLANLEANIDFASEDIVVASNEQIFDRLLSVNKKIEILLGQYKLGRMAKEGLSLLFVGEPNAGKSSLLNALVKEEKAIVTEIPGTTRDMVEGTLEIKGLPIRIIDTAGYRQTDDVVEMIGIKRMEEGLEAVDFVFVLVDGITMNTAALDFVIQKVPAEKLIVGVSKADLLESSKLENTWLKSHFDESLYSKLIEKNRVFNFSSKSGIGINRLLDIISVEVEDMSELRSSGLMNARHFELLSKANEYTKNGMQSLKNDESPELVAEEFHAALRAIYEILGDRFDDQVMDRVFREFCLGK